MVISVYNVNEGWGKRDDGFSQEYYANSDNESPAPLYTDTRGI